ncbi:HNH endonuclease family protein [Reyranella sp.]|uniref:HNH endonuclease family protein n=1 Tax=Reyranella sp. TaxID=1929291 RepID=UPI00272F8CEC|nr:HNH endonuclease family protein [Reyranella sp.]MDP2376070.1 HNH endonuclease family protein [Reyranella sp.]
MQLDDAEKKEIRKALDGDIYTVTRIRLPLLLRLDELLSGGSAVYNHPIVSVEHVLPQNPASGSQWRVDFPDDADREQWVHKLANLVLLTRRKNSQAGNLDFQDKKSKYFATKAGVSNFALTSKVLSENAWTLGTLKRRQLELIGAIETLWRLK